MRISQDFINNVPQIPSETSTKGHRDPVRTPSARRPNAFRTPSEHRPNTVKTRSEHLPNRIRTKAITNSSETSSQTHPELIKIFECFSELYGKSFQNLSGSLKISSKKSPRFHPKRQPRVTGTPSERRPMGFISKWRPSILKWKSIISAKWPECL